jgi:hypothetical protein
MSVTIEKIQEFAQKVKSGDAPVKPGTPHFFSGAETPTRDGVTGDGVWQGDLGVEVIESIDPSYKLVENPTPQDAQLVPGQTVGSRHCLKDVNTVKLYRPAGWGTTENAESLVGPQFVAIKDTVIDHPTHGAVHVPAGMCINISYQRNLDLITKQEKRARD